MAVKEPPQPFQPGVGPTQKLSLRVSVGVLAGVVFDAPDGGGRMIALERKATLVREDGRDQVRLRAQPFGGAVRILEPQALTAQIGPWRYDSQRSYTEQDLRIFIQPGAWEVLRQYCLQQFSLSAQAIFESDPRRELEEEFAEALNLRLSPDQYILRYLGAVEERTPTPTENIHASGFETVRIYGVHEMRVVDQDLIAAMLANNREVSDQALVERAQQDAFAGGKGRANAVLVLPLDLVRTQFHPVQAGVRHPAVVLEGHVMEGNIQALLAGGLDGDR